MDPDDFLAHYGVQGMHWGVRRDRTTQVVDIKTKPGKRVKAKGGKYHEPSNDAIVAATSRRIAKRARLILCRPKNSRLLLGV